MLDRESLEAIADAEPDNPAAEAAALVAAIDEGQIADGADVPYALNLAADLTEDADDLAGAIALADRALSVIAATDGDDGPTRANRARLLIAADRSAEGMAELTALRPLLLTDSDAPVYLAEALVESEQAVVAEEWLTVAVQQVMAGMPEEESAADDEQVFLLFQLATTRHEVRHVLELPHDEIDELAEEMEQAAGSTGVPQALFWPEAELALLPSPAISWDDHRADVESALAEWSTSAGGGALLYAGSAAGLASFARERGLDPQDEETLDEYADSLAEQVAPIEWPPGRNDPCWCGSGAKYKKCCLPRSRA